MPQERAEVCYILSPAASYFPGREWGKAYNQGEGPSPRITWVERPHARLFYCSSLSLCFRLGSILDFTSGWICWRLPWGGSRSRPPRQGFLCLPVSGSTAGLQVNILKSARPCPPQAGSLDRKPGFRARERHSGLDTRTVEARVEAAWEPAGARRLSPRRRQFPSGHCNSHKAVQRRPGAAPAATGLGDARRTALWDT